MVSKHNRLKIYGGSQDPPQTWWPPNMPKQNGEIESLSDFSDIEEVNPVESIMQENAFQKRFSIREINE